MIPLDALNKVARHISPKVRFVIFIDCENGLHFCRSKMPNYIEDGSQVVCAGERQIVDYSLPKLMRSAGGR